MSSDYELFFENWFTMQCIEFSFFASVWFAQLGVL